MAIERPDAVESITSPDGDTEADMVRKLDTFFWTGRLVPLFPLGAFTPQSECPHRGPIRPGSTLCCMVCSRSGMDGHPSLKWDRRFGPRPERKPDALIPERQTRRERRKAKHDASGI